MPSFVYLCECRDVRCKGRMRLTTVRYERLRMGGNVVLRGHGGNDSTVVVREGDVEVVKSRSVGAGISSAGGRRVRDRRVEMPELRGVGVRVW